MMNNKKELPKLASSEVQENYTKWRAKCQGTNQCKAILEYMIEHGSITTFEAFANLWCARLSARIYDLRRLGIPIRREAVYKNGKTFAKYYLITGEEEE